MHRSFLPWAVAAICLAGCGQAPPPAAPPAVSPAAGPAATASESTVALPAAPATEAAIRAEDLAAQIKIIASDEFAGRQPGGPGERKTVGYLASEFARLGLKPGNGDSYVQQVPMVEIVSEASGPVAITFADGASDSLKLGDEAVIQTLREDPESAVKDSDLVFVGFGVNAPELGWNDYAGIDVKGKTVVVLVNDPGFETGDPQLFRGKAMTYYGRWTYKYEEALRQGAAAALIVHDDAGAAYGWEVVRNSFSGAEFDLPHQDGDPQPLAIRGWITGAAAQRVFAHLGHDYASLRKAANQSGFKAVSLDAKVSMGVQSRVRRAQSANVVGLLPGSEHPEEVVVFTAHWDHLGRNFQMPKDGIFNGAIDNATGVASLLELAEAFAQSPTPPKRSLLFLSVTLEESGLLGSRYYVQNPVMPLKDTVATLNMDAIQVIGKTRDVVVIGFGNSELEDILKRHAEAQGRIIVPEPTPENGFYYRSDHFNFAIAGVPSLYAKNGIDHVEKGEAYGRQVAADYVAKAYHKPADEFDPNWDLSGNVQDTELLYAVAREIADGDQWPNWYQGTEFRAARDAMRP
ncbi:MAG TPA: M28 family metallopeptidase [Xanthomonadales bacterium]|nr:M28 family metallopeptidase [Xanthomonadales bacterium]